ncbi:aldehyde dehydrogenase family protein [Arthrobacter bambusae]|uniref:aldehyde dehydrogenase family protein n=1 Tax=Arthrobacter bambusae TaxID=1338426 RepID=UPI00278A38C1|nr:aldehyde dehydrogenase family protein [Arthrobacter bambusae]MDQ0240418.1 aldehyde dehydrogenase (NAD+) [Arthrobacter bambusae]
MTEPATSFINGAWIEGTGAITYRYNPAAPSEAVTAYRQAGSEDLAMAIQAATAAGPAWDSLGILARGRVLSTAARLIRERAEEIARTMTAEHGKTLAESRMEVDASADTFDYHAGSARNPVGAEYPSSHPEERIVTIRRPLGIIGVITPWNFPLQIPAWKIAPALLHGNTVVWKSASNTPGVSVLLMDILAKAGVPAGVANLLLGPGTLGSELVSHPKVAGVTFTGSVPVGHQIRSIVCGRGAKLQMELGGHNATLVLPDADPELAASSSVNAAMGSTGQKCTATRRIILVGDGHEEFLRKLTEKVAALTVGPGTDPSTQIGPVVSASARDEITSAISQALSEGAQIIAQAAIPDSDGSYVPPTVLTGPASLTICQEEVFGPIVTVLRASSLDDAIALANSTDFGLTAAVFTGDERTARKCVTYLEAGLVKVNAPSTGSELHAPFGGMKDSTFAGPREQNSAAAAAFFTHEKTAYLRLAPEKA